MKRKVRRARKKSFKVKAEHVIAFLVLLAIAIVKIKGAVQNPTPANELQAAEATASVVTFS